MTAQGMQALYQELILDHARAPRRAGLREPFDIEVQHVNPTCGDQIRLRVRLSVDAQRVEDVSYDSIGCSISVAGASVMADDVTGATVPEAMERYEIVLDVVQGRRECDSEADAEALGDVAAFAGVRTFPARVKCALLGWAAMRDAVAQAVQTRASASYSDDKENEETR